MCVSVIGLGSRIVGDVNWAIERVCKERPEPSQSRLSLLRSESGRS